MGAGRGGKGVGFDVWCAGQAFRRLMHTLDPGDTKVETGRSGCIPVVGGMKQDALDGGVDIEPGVAGLKIGEEGR